MRLLALSVALLSVSLYGAGFPEFSHTGLEGIAKDGLYVIVEDYSDRDKDFDLKAIENQIELRLRQSGIKVATRAGNYLLINAVPLPANGYALQIEAKRFTTFEANGKTYTTKSSVWSHTLFMPKAALRKNIDKIMDEFLLDYLKANPKKKEK